MAKQFKGPRISNLDEHVKWMECDQDAALRMGFTTVRELTKSDDDLGANGFVFVTPSSSHKPELFADLRRHRQDLSRTSSRPLYNEAIITVPPPPPKSISSQSSSMKTSQPSKPPAVVPHVTQQRNWVVPTKSTAPSPSPNAHENENRFGDIDDELFMNIDVDAIAAEHHGRSTTSEMPAPLPRPLGGANQFPSQRVSSSRNSFEKEPSGVGSFLQHGLQSVSQSTDGPTMSQQHSLELQEEVEVQTAQRHATTLADAFRAKWGRDVSTLPTYNATNRSLQTLSFRANREIGEYEHDLSVASASRLTSSLPSSISKFQHLSSTPMSSSFLSTSHFQNTSSTPMTRAERTDRGSSFQTPNCNYDDHGDDWGDHGDVETFDSQIRGQPASGPPGRYLSGLPEGSSRGGNSSAVREDAAPHCLCNEPCIKLMSSSQANPGRQFWKCVKGGGAGGGCDHFAWCDGLVSNASGHGAVGFGAYGDGGGSDMYSLDGDHGGEDDESVIRSFPKESKNPFVQNRDIFGHRGFRPGQRQVVVEAMKGRDVFCLMPTGGGKSLCYQLPAFCCPGLSVVFSPLLSLIQDQAEGMIAIGVEAVFLNSAQDYESEVRPLLAKLRNLPAHDSVKLLYITPEKLSRSGQMISILKELYTRNRLSRFVVDEAHCLSQWGHDFRPDYMKLNMLRAEFPKVPIMALTATANASVVRDISTKLSLRNQYVFQSSFNRPNLRYFINSKTKKSIDEIAAYISTKHSHHSGIIYCLSRKNCEQTSDALKKLLPHMRNKITFYHAELDPPEREKRQKDWSRGSIKLIIATVAFGMGINKPDVRYVIHFSLPKSLTHYYQESGRAGRDGLESECLLYFSFFDKSVLEMMVRKSDLTTPEKKEAELDQIHRVVSYCLNEVDCRRKVVLEHFGEQFDAANCHGTCDNCRDCPVIDTKDLTAHAALCVQLLKQLIGSGRGNVTLLQLVQAFRGANNKATRTAGYDRADLFGSGKDLAPSVAERLVQELVLRKYLTEESRENSAGYSSDYICPGRRSHELNGLQTGAVLIKFRSSVRGRKTTLEDPVNDDGDEPSQKTPRQKSEKTSKVRSKSPTLGPSSKKAKKLSPKKSSQDQASRQGVLEVLDSGTDTDSNDEGECRVVEKPRLKHNVSNNTIVSRFFQAEGISGEVPRSIKTTTGDKIGRLGSKRREREISNLLRAWAEEYGAEINTSAYHIVGDSGILDLSKRVPTSKEELKKMSGWGLTKVVKHGDRLIGVINGFLHDNNIELSSPFVGSAQEELETSASPEDIYQGTNSICGRLGEDDDDSGVASSAFRSFSAADECDGDFEVDPWE